MHDKLTSFIESLKADRRINSFDEAATKQAVVTRLLSLIGWDIFNIDEVTPEYSIGEGRVDYSLRIGNVNKVFIEVKKIGEELEKHQEQLLEYSFKQGVRLSILTNGVTWWFYLPWQEGSWEQRKFFTIDIVQQESNDVVSKFIDFLMKDNIDSGRAIKNAEEIYKGQQKLTILNETLPKAWNKIIEEADDSLIELINDTAEKLCGFKADPELIERFLLNNKNHVIISATAPIKTIHHASPKSIPLAPAPMTTPDGYTGKSVSSFYFKGVKYEVRFWKDVLIRLCEILNNEHGDEFKKVLSLRGRKRPYFSSNKDELWEPRKINNSNLFVETNLSANSIVKICFDILAVFGYSNNDLKIVPI